MPNLNKTGPLGQGPRTGWGRGPCGAGMSMGRGFGRGFGRFWGSCPYLPKMTKKEEKEILSEETEVLEEELKAIKKRLSDIGAKN